MANSPRYRIVPRGPSALRDRLERIRMLCFLRIRGLALLP